MATLAFRDFFGSVASTGGTGTLTIGADAPGRSGLADISPGVAAEIDYVIFDGSQIEWGTGTVSSDGTTFTRDTISGTVASDGTRDETSPAALTISVGAKILWMITSVSAAVGYTASMNQGVATTDSPTFAGMTLTKAGVLALAMLNSTAAVGLDISMDADAARITANAATPLGLGANNTDDQLVLNVDGTITATGGGSLTGTWSDLGSVTTIDINGGTIDGTVIGGSAAAAGSFTTLSSSGFLAVNGASAVAPLSVLRTGAGIQDVAHIMNGQTKASGVGSALGFSDAAGVRASYIAGVWDGATDDNGHFEFYTRQADVLSLALTLAADKRAIFAGDTVVPNTFGYRVGGATDTYIGELANIAGVLSITTDTNRDIQLGDTSGYTLLLDTSAKSATFASDVNLANGSLIANNLRTYFKGSAAAPCIQIDADGTGADTGFFGNGDTGTENVGVTVAGVQQLLISTSAATFAGTALVSVGDLNVSGMVNLGSPTELTISAGAITVTKSFHTVDTEADAATDELTTINGGAEGDRLIIKPISSARTVVVKDGAGNIECAGDFTMDNEQDTMELIYVGTKWLELTRSNNNI